MSACSASEAWMYSCSSWSEIRSRRCSNPVISESVVGLDVPGKLLVAVISWVSYRKAGLVPVWSVRRCSWVDQSKCNAWQVHALVVTKPRVDEGRA